MAWTIITQTWLEHRSNHDPQTWLQTGKAYISNNSPIKSPSSACVKKSQCLLSDTEARSKLLSVSVDPSKNRMKSKWSYQPQNASVARNFIIWCGLLGVWGKQEVFVSICSLSLLQCPVTNTRERDWRVQSGELLREVDWVELNEH